MWNQQLETTIPQTLVDIPPQIGAAALVAPIIPFIALVGAPLPVQFQPEPYRFGEIGFDDTPSAFLHESLHDVGSSLRRDVTFDWEPAESVPLDTQAAVPEFSNVELGTQDMVLGATINPFIENGNFVIDAGVALAA